MDIDDLTEEVDVYQPNTIVGADKNPLTAAMTLAKASLPINIHRGMGAMKPEEIMLLVADAPEGAVGYCSPTSFYVDGALDLDSLEATLHHNNVLSLANGEAWTVAARPSVRTRFEETAHVRLLLTRLRTDRAGLPPVRA